MNKDAKIVQRKGAVNMRKVFTSYLMFLWNTFGSGAQKIAIWSTYNLGFKLLILLGIII